MATDDIKDTVEYSGDAKLDEKQSISQPEGIPRPEDLKQDMALQTGEADNELKERERRLLWKIDLRLLPTLSVMYLLASLDRGNIGNARLGGLEADLHLEGNDFYNALSIFYAGYVLCQIPSNLMVKTMRPSRWIGITMTLWGVCSTCMAATKNAAGIFAARFFLGCFETGIGPSAPLILSFWYRREEMSSRLAVFLGSSTVAGAFGGALAYGVLGHLQGAQGLAAWRWLFIIEGIPTICLGLLAFVILPDFPASVGKRWLTPEEKELAIQRGASAFNTDTSNFDMRQVKAALLDYKNWMTALVYTGLNAPLASYTSFLPTIVKTLGFTNLQAQLLTIPPYIAACVYLAIMCYLSDKLKQRAIFIIIVSMTATLGYMFLLIGNNVALQYVGACFAAMGLYPLIPLTLSWISNNQLGHSKRAVALAMANTMSQTLSVLGTQIYKTVDAPAYRPGHAICLAFTCMTWGTALVLRYILKKENAAKDKQYGVPGEIDEKHFVGAEDMYDKHPGFRYIL
ncbi:hypothetical protein K450DRAFT_225028 [Umbelopsis ramanniana AG]|uniref:Major facilitator superfamily (MFS) profile domain-containing protein n=1 Tax=Umbelopsis ramanniana AG TaxID=1314678 RepID=A0AAD5EFN1_UMBRA|nr:uncharacterized protein K450DRAFT_225028 [Umbelopsis ramanniana AG]KAI8582833.1 hypothetical protein K450DRAFT_225028 [Umbelopsis ramanniana AG]